MIRDGNGQIMNDNGNDGTGNLYRYEDILRAIGKHIDQEGLQDVIVLQTEDEMDVHGYRSVSPAGGPRPHLLHHTFTAEEIRKIDEESRKRRGKGSRLFG
jgi:hypothetical protein